MNDLTPDLVSGSHTRRYRAGTAWMMLAVCAALTACASQPTDGGDEKTTAATPELSTPAPDTAAAADAPTASDTDGTTEEPAPASPVCQPAPADTPPKPRPKPKPVHVRRQQPKQPETAPAVEALPAGRTITADVKPFATSVVSILGKKVEGPSGDDMGRVVDVLADASGRVRVAIIDFGGFLGVGNRRIAVDWPLLRFDPDDHDKPLTLSLTRDQLQNAPEYRESPHPTALMVPSAAEPAPTAAAAAPAAPAANDNTPAK